jgi:hypothetical protein
MDGWAWSAIEPWVTERRLGHSHLSTTSTDLQGIDTEEIISIVHARGAHR